MASVPFPKPKRLSKTTLYGTRVRSGRQAVEWEVGSVASKKSASRIRLMAI